jgi:hypothetical protein
MRRAMAMAAGVEQTIEMEAILGLAASHAVGREDLEEATMEVERVLDEFVIAITDGASASADFEAGCIEVDLILTGASMGELYQKVALVVTQLDRYCETVNIALEGAAVPTAAGVTQFPPMTLQGSKMKRVSPVKSAAGALTAV